MKYLPGPRLKVCQNESGLKAHRRRREPLYLLPPRGYGLWKTGVRQLSVGASDRVSSIPNLFHPAPQDLKKVHWILVEYPAEGLDPRGGGISGIFLHRKCFTGKVA